MKLIIFVLSLGLIPLSTFAANNHCRFEVDPTTVKVSWTAFKTTEKVPVHGTINEVEIKTPPKGAKNLVGLLARVKASGSIDSEKKSDSGNPGRDLTLFQKFFSLFKAQGKFEGSFHHVKGNEKSGELSLFLLLNGKTKEVPMNYTLADDGSFEATGEFEMKIFSLDAALASLHQACEELHKGKDGVSKTWPIVGLKVTAKINKDCSKK